MPIANGEPVALLDAIEAHASSLTGVRIHQMHALRDRRYLHGDFGDCLHHVSYFLSHVTRDRFAEGTIDLVPNHFSQVPDLLRRTTTDPLVICTVSPPDRHGYFSLGTNADYVASVHRRARFFVEANPKMPRTLGRNQIHISQVVGWNYHDVPLVEIEPATPTDIDRRLARLRGRACRRRLLHPDRHRHDPERHREQPDGPPGPRHPHRVDLRRHRRPDRSGRGNGGAKAQQPDQGRRHVRAGQRQGVRVPRRQPRGGALARQLRQQPPAHRRRAELHLDQRNGRGRSARPVCVRDHRRALLVLEWRPVRFRAGRLPVGQGQRVHRAAIHRPERHRLADRARVPPRHGDHDVEEHGRSCRHRVGGGRTAGPLDRGAGTGARLDRRSVVPRRAHGGGVEVADTCENGARWSRRPRGYPPSAARSPSLLAGSDDPRRSGSASSGERRSFA